MRLYGGKWINATNLHNRQKRVLQYKTLIKGKVVVETGAELDLNGMEVRFSDGASIIVNVGVLKANRAKFTASLDANQTMLIIRNTASLSIEKATFSGANIVRAIACLKIVHLWEKVAHYILRALLPIICKGEVFSNAYQRIKKRKFKSY